MSEFPSSVVAVSAPARGTVASIRIEAIPNALIVVQSVRWKVISFRTVGSVEFSVLVRAVVFEIAELPKAAEAALPTIDSGTIEGPILGAAGGEVICTFNSNVTECIQVIGVRYTVI